MLEGKFRSDLTEPLATVRSAHALLCKAIHAALDSSPAEDVRARNVTLKLLTRIARDLRCAGRVYQFTAMLEIGQMASRENQAADGIPKPSGLPPRLELPFHRSRRWRGSGDKDGDSRGVRRRSLGSRGGVRQRKDRCTLMGIEAPWWEV